MADASQQLSNLFNAAKQAINDDLKQNYYNAAQNRNYAFRQLNNNANARHAMFSGAPMGAQMQYDRNTYLPSAATLAEKAIQKQLDNQDIWDRYMEQIKQYEDQANYYNNLANKVAGQSTK